MRIDAAWCCDSCDGLPCLSFPGSPGLFEQVTLEHVSWRCKARLNSAAWMNMTTKPDPSFPTSSKSPRRRLQIFVSPIFWGGKRMETVLAIQCTKEHLTVLIQTVWTWTLRNQNSCQQGNPRPAKSQTEASTAIVPSTPSTYCQNLPKQSFVEQFVCLVSPGWQKHWGNVSAVKSGKQSKQQKYKEIKDLDLCCSHLFRFFACTYQSVSCFNVSEVCILLKISMTLAQPNLFLSEGCNGGAGTGTAHKHWDVSLTC